MRIVTVDRQFVALHDDPVAHFLSYYQPSTLRDLKLALKQFLNWLNRQEGWSGIGPRELLIHQLQAENQYEIPDLIQAFAYTFSDLRKPTVLNKANHIVQFFRKNRCPLPEDVNWNWFQVQSTVPKIQGQLTVDVIRDVILDLPLRWRSLFLVKYQAMLDTSRLYWLNVHGARQVTKQLRGGRRIVRIDGLPTFQKSPFSRSQKHPTYFTFFGRDGASSLKWYFDEERGWPRPGEPLWVFTQDDLKYPGNAPCDNRRVGGAIHQVRMAAKWLQLTRSLGHVPQRVRHSGPHARFGYNLQEFRNVAMSELYIHARPHGLDMDCVKFWCELLWQIDGAKLEYDKSYKDSEYMERQYAIAEPYLNIISGTPDNGVRKTTLQDTRSYQITFTVPTSTQLSPVC